MTQGRGSAEQTQRTAQPEARRLLAEGLGTMMLTLVAGGVDTVAKTTGQVSEPARAVAPALLVMVVVFVLGGVSGAHINPAVSLAFAVRRVFPWSRLPGYWAAQVLGAVVGGLLLRALFAANAVHAVPQRHLTVPRAFVVEGVLTAFLVVTILGSATRAQLLGPEAALPVGGVLTLDGIVGIPLTGASMNPARALGPAVVTGDTSYVWLVYVLGAMAGALLAVAVAWLVYGEPQAEEEKAASGQGE